jgi:dTDP-4-dehydrorhamnose 3,5-epimerase
MHFQVKNSAQQKLVTCPVGKVLDVIVDVRIESPYFNKPISIELGEKEPLAILIGKGYAHGFLSLTDNSFMQYLTSTVHSPAHDKGVLWSSIDFNWPTDSPKISNRDSNHPAIGREICIFS